MADEELEAGEGGKKSPILAYILIGVGVVVALAITIVATMYFVGYFDPDSAERIEATVQQLEMDAEEAEVEDTSEASVEALVDALADTITRVTGVEVTAADDAPPIDDAPDLEADADLDLDAAAADEEEAADDLLDEEEMIEETVRRVTKRIAAAKKRDQLAETITSRIMERLASKK